MREARDWRCARRQIIFRLACRPRA
jgi:hypothetical protein